MKKTVIWLIVGYVVFSLIRSVGTSLFFSPRNRITMVYYGQTPKILSVGRADGVNYEFFFNTDKKVLVPGGYGRYRIGALGKLAEIEKNRKLIANTFSSMLSAQVDYDMSGHIALLDRVYLYFLLLQQKKSDYISLKTDYVNPANPDEFSENSFQKKYKGFFYDKRLREEGKNVSLVYSTYSSVKTLSRIMEGKGIRVVDVSFRPKMGPECYIIDSAKTSATSQYLANVYSCSIRAGTVSGADIQMVLGKKLESQWE